MGKGYRWWPNEELVRWVGDRRFGTVLEAGCGAGGNMWFLREHADDLYGIDTCEQALLAATDYLDRRGAADVTLLTRDVRQTGLPDAHFDLVVDCMTSQHMPWVDHPALYAEHRRVLKPGGFLWLYHLDSRTASMRGMFKDGFDWDGLALFPDVGFFCLPIPTQLSDVVETAGFRMPIVRGLAREYPGGQCAHYSIIEAEAA